ncbi:MAG: methyltransferase domain-containing protein [Cyclobacteriaceae bacterium]|nr:methyltransferase domain-containing protein [Cyclobacteriaceae bacterium]
MQQQDPLETPVLFLIFNRPDLTRQVFGQIRKVKPRQLFVAADGPRLNHPDDIEKCALTRQLVMDMIDWDCEVKTLFRDENLGCGLAVSQAITWFFEHVEMGIILEDDCYPDLSFFWFCAELLEYYKDDERVMMVSGTRLINDTNDLYSYFFSTIGTIWGWATWKRSWYLYDYHLEKLEVLISSRAIYNVATEDHEINARIRNLKKIKQGHFDTWDYQWTLARLINNGLSIIPSKNLISNKGCNSSGTHTQSEKNSFANLQIQDCVFPINHPLVISPNKNYDKIVSKYIYPKQTNKSYYQKIRTKISNYNTKNRQLSNLKNKTNLNLHLGCGNRIINGWVNIDLQNSDLDLDLSKGVLPFTNESVAYVVSQHFFEHLHLDSELLQLLNDILRVLKSKGELWFSVPSIEKIAHGYMTDQGKSLLIGRQARFPEYSLNGKPISHIVNEIFYQNGEHKNLFDFDIINWMLTKTGYINVTEVNEKEFMSKFNSFPKRNDDDVSIYCKATKP